MPIIHNHRRVFDEAPPVDLSQFPDRIAETFKGKTVFITGATGSVGRAVVEKILRFTDVKRIYILIKNKRGQDPQTRFAKYFNDDFFGLLLKDFPEAPKKVQCIEGDLSEFDLGISCEDRGKLINEVDIIYHNGASVRFDENIKKIVLLNVRGTRAMIALAKEVEHLQLFVHVSTCYCQPRYVVLPEQPSVPPHNPHDIIRIVENMDDATLNVLTPKLVGSYGNTYTFSKALAEAVVFEQMDKLPIMVIRPSIILPCLEYPIPGYTDSLYGPLTFWILYAKGLLHITNISPHTTMEYIPLDMVVNTFLITTYNYINNTERKVTVCNATNISTCQKPLQDAGIAIVESCPPEPVLFYPWFIYTSSPTLFFLMHLFTQLIPAFLFDTVIKVTGIKSKISLVDLQRKVQRGCIIVSFYGECDEWYIKNDVIRILRMDLNEREDKTYSLDIDNFDILEYSKDSLLNIRKYVLLEKDEDLPKARQRLATFKIIHYILKTCLISVALWLAYTKILPSLITLLYYIADM